MHDADVARRNSATAEIGGHHEPLARDIVHHVVGEKHLPAQVHRFARVRIAHCISIRAGECLHAVDVGVHTGVEVLVARHGGCEVGVEHHLVEHREVAVHAEFEPRLGVRHHARARGLGTRARNRGHRDLVHAGHLDQVPSLVLGGIPAIGEQVGDCLGGIHRRAAAEAHDGRRQRPRRTTNLAR